MARCVNCSLPLTRLSAWGVAALLTAIVTGISTFAGGEPTLAWGINALVAGILLYLRPEAPKISDDPDEGGQGKMRPLSL